jgi:hypothetical protein
MCATNFCIAILILQIYSLLSYPFADNLHSLTKKSAGVGGSGGEGERLRKRSKTPRKDEFTEFSQERGNEAFSRWHLL